MSRAMENYICASEDRPHYNNETDLLYGFQYPMRSPRVTIIQENYVTEIIKEEIPEEKLTELIEARIPQVTEAVIEGIGDSLVTTENVDDVIDEIYGGSALDLAQEEDGI